MKPIRRPRICVEILEERNCPSLSAFFDGSTLTIRGMPHPNSQYTSPGVGGLQVQGKGTNEVQVTDGTAEIGIFAAESVNLQLANHIASTITVDLNANVLSGNLTIGLGTGNNETNAIDTFGTGILNGTVRGNIQVSGGGGEEFLGLGETSQGFPTFGSLTVGGNVYFSGKLSSKVALSNGNFLDTGTQFPGSSQVVTIGGSLITNGIGTVDVSGPNGAFNAKTRVGGNFIANGGGNPFSFEPPGFASGGGIIMFGSVAGNVDVTGTPGSAADNIFMGGANTTASVGGNININLGNGANSVFLEVPTIGGSVALNMGNGSNTIYTGDFAMNVGGNLSLNMGNGSNSFSDDSLGVTGIASNVTVQGNLSVNLGNGANSIGAVSSSIYGDLDVRVGNGPNSITVDGTTGAAINGTFNYTGGNGGNSVTIDNASANSVTMNVRFGSLPANLFTIAAGTTAATLRGTVAWSVPTLASTTNGYVDNGYAWTNAVQLINIPS